MTPRQPHQPTRLRAKAARRDGVSVTGGLLGLLLLCLLLIGLQAGV